VVVLASGVATTVAAATAAAELAAKEAAELAGREVAKLTLKRVASILVKQESRNVYGQVVQRQLTTAEVDAIAAQIELNVIERQIPARVFCPILDVVLKNLSKSTFDGGIWSPDVRAGAILAVTAGKRRFCGLIP
jgi:hypothetical protein